MLNATPPTDPLFEPRELALTFVDRAVPFWPMTEWLYHYLPSLHVTTGVLSLALLGRRRRALLFGTLLVLILAASILTSKQHYFLDAVAGASLGLTAYGLFFRWQRVHVGER